MCIYLLQSNFICLYTSFLTFAENSKTFTMCAKARQEDQKLIVKQSNHLTFSRKTFNAEQRRIFYEVIRLVQNMPEVEEIYQQEMFTQRVDIPIKNVLTKNSKDYDGVWDAAYDMMQKPITLNYTDEHEQKIETTVFSNVRNESTKGCITVYINPIIWQLMVNVSKNHTKFNLEIARKLPNAAAMTLYEIISCRTAPITLNIDTLKNMLGMNDRYPNNSNFIKYVIEASKKYIDKYSHKTFEFKTMKKGRKIAAITIKPILITSKEQ